MTVFHIPAFRTPVVREMTDAEYRRQRERVIASVIKDKRDARASAQHPAR
jgi:hypothetical protein